jgi:hypothetical protein
VCISGRKVKAVLVHICVCVRSVALIMALL